MRRQPAQNPDPVEMILDVYRRGWFPMTDLESGRIELFDPDPRAVIPLDAYHLSRSLRKRVRSRRYDVTSDRAVEEVLRACADPRRDGGWIDEQLISLYLALFRRGHLHTVEAWLETDDGPELLGGLFGVHLNGVFAAESMFSRPDLGGVDASKVCLAHLFEHLNARGFALLDVQCWNEHLDQFNCVELGRDEYKRMLAPALRIETSWGPFDPERAVAACGGGVDSRP